MPATGYVAEPVPGLQPRRRHRRAGSGRVCSPASRSPLRSDPALRGYGIDAGTAHARPELALDDDARSNAPSRMAPFRATV